MLSWLTGGIRHAVRNSRLGTHERLIGFLIEHCAGNFPLWLAAEQVRALPIGGEDEDNADTQQVIADAKSFHAELRAAGIRAYIDLTSGPIKAKIAHAKEKKAHTMLVLGKRDLDAASVAVRIHG